MEKTTAFLKCFEIKRVINNESISTENIFNQLRSHLSDKQMRHFLSGGVEYCRDQPESTNPLMNDIHQSLTSLGHSHAAKSSNNKSENKWKMRSSNPNSSSSNSSSTSNCAKVFNISNLKCTIFQYLDIRSLSQCANVSSDWLRDANHISSQNHFDSTVLKYACENNQMRTILGYRRANSVIIHSWKQSLNQLFSDLIYFTKIRTLTLLNGKSPSLEYTRVMKILMENNSNNIKNLDISGPLKLFEVENINNIHHDNDNNTASNSSNKNNAESRSKNINNSSNSNDNNNNNNSLFFKNLQSLTIRKTLNYVPFGSCLKRLVFFSLEFNLTFWKYLNRCHLYNIQSIVFDEPSTRHESFATAQTIKNQLIPQIATKLVNLREFTWLSPIRQCHEELRLAMLSHVSQHVKILDLLKFDVSSSMQFCSVPQYNCCFECLKKVSIELRPALDKFQIEQICKILVSNKKNFKSEDSKKSTNTNDNCNDKIIDTTNRNQIICEALEIVTHKKSINGKEATDIGKRLFKHCLSICALLTKLTNETRISNLKSLTIRTGIDSTIYACNSKIYNNVAKIFTAIGQLSNKNQMEMNLLFQIYDNSNDWKKVTTYLSKNFFLITICEVMQKMYDKSDVKDKLDIRIELPIMDEPIKSAVRMVGSVVNPNNRNNNSNDNTDGTQWLEMMRNMLCNDNLLKFRKTVTNEHIHGIQHIYSQSENLGQIVIHTNAHATRHRGEVRILYKHADYQSGWSVDSCLT